MLLGFTIYNHPSISHLHNSLPVANRNNTRYCTVKDLVVYMYTVFKFCVLMEFYFLVHAINTSLYTYKDVFKTVRYFAICCIVQKTAHLCIKISD